MFQWLNKLIARHKNKRYLLDPVLWCKDMGIKLYPKQKELIRRWWIGVDLCAFDSSDATTIAIMNLRGKVLRRYIIQKSNAWEGVRALMTARKRKIGTVVEFKDEYAFLSNFYPAEVEYEGIKYPTSEHAYQASKTMDEMQRNILSQLDTPGKAKRYGNNVDLRPDWNNIRIDMMTKIVRTKFLAHIDLATKLLETGNMELVEGNKHKDRFWGKVLNESTGEWEGENHLGIILMDIRKEFRNIYKG